MTDYVELHLHDYYSLLDGLNSPEEYMARAKELGMTYLAQTNHGTLSGHRDFQKSAKEADITPILGLEAYISSTDRFDKRAAAKRTDGTSVYNHIILLAQNETGLKTLSRLSEKAWFEGFYSKPRMDNELLFSDNEGIIVLSGCLSGMICKALAREDIFTAKQVAKQYKEALGDRFFIEVQGHNPVEINTGLLAIADELDIKAVATSDCHYARKEDLWIEEAMLILSTGPKAIHNVDLAKSKKMEIIERLNYLYPERKMTFQEFEIFLRGRKDHMMLFEGQGIGRTDIYENTVEIANRIGDYPYFTGMDLLPKPKTENPDDMLARMAWAGLKRRGKDKDPVYVDRLKEELAIFKMKGYSPYIIVVEDIVTWARSRSIPTGPGRGSSVGSLVLYALYVIGVDPIKHGLLFFRFVDPERDDMPDVDLDFADNRRAEVKAYVARKYKNVANIATFGTFQGKSSLKAAGQVFRIPLGEMNKVTKDNDAPPNADYFEYFDVGERGRAFNRKHPEVRKLAGELYGRLRSGGMHASGVVISNQPISNYGPMETAKDPNDKAGPRVPMIAYDMVECANIGLIKMDFLGLKAMTIIDDTIKSISERHKIVIDPYEIDLEDRKVYQMMSDGYTKGIFQCEANAYTKLIIQMGGVWSFNELAASNALVRPGAMKTIGMEYIARKNHQKATEYAHKDLYEFTNETFGEIIYQEQVMLAVVKLADMSMSDANKIRTIIGKKKDPIEFEKYKEAFVTGATGRLGVRKAEKLWKDFEAHAGYSFNKSHAVAYSMVSYWTAWLKYYYPLEFMAAVLKNEGEKDAITDYLIESKRLGLNVYLPHVNKSKLHIDIQNEGIRLGLTNVKFIKDKTGSAIIEHRPYKNYAELKDKVLEKGSGMNTRVLDSLNAIGGACFDDNPKNGHERDNFYEYLQIPAFEVKDLEPKVKVKFRTLDEYDDVGAFPVLAMVRSITRKDGWGRVDVVDETGSAGIFMAQDTPLESGQMYAMLVAKNRISRYMTLDELSEKIPNGFTKYLYDDIEEVDEGSYYVVSFKLYVTKAGKKMAHMVFMDHLGEMMFVMAFPQNYMQAYLKCREGITVRAELRETDDGSLFMEAVL